MSNVIVGLDPSLTGTGMCALDVDLGTKLLGVDTVSTKNLRGIPRLIHIRHEVHTFLQRFEAKAVFIEGYGFGCRGAAVFSLGELGGVLRTELYESKYPYYDIAPTVLKKYVCGKGNAQKNVMLEQVYRKFGLGSDILTDDNQVDAYGLAQLGCALFLWKENKEKFSKETYTLFAKIGAPVIQ